jgi:multidrug efflux pump subunit AcrB
MWIVRLALARPYTFIVMALVIVLLTPVALLRTPTDIFPDINIPVISLVWTYTGLQPQEMELRITSNVERGISTLVSDVEHVESQSLPGIAVIKVFFQPGANIQTALAQTAAISQTFLRFLPPWTTPPLVIIYSASTVPVLQIGLTSNTLSEQQLFDFGNNFIRTQLATVQGAATPFPYGGKQRYVSVDIDSASLQAKGLSAVDIVNAVNAQNLILPTGTAKIGTLEYNVEMNGSPQTIAELNDLPVKTQNGATIYMKDVAHIRDGFAPQTNVVLANGQRGVLMSIYKTGNASTLSIVDRVKEMLTAYSSSLPEGLKLTLFFDQSLFVRAAIQGVLREALIAACLTAAMILLFLGNWKSTVIIAVSIPLSILVSVLCLSALGETVNIMTLGGLALAVGILVDDATVEIENINRNLAMGKETVQAILDGAQQIAVPAFVSTLCICIVFIPMFFLSGVAKFLFVPLAEAVIFAMLASYMWSRTIVPTLAMYLLSSEDEYRAEEHAGQKQGFFRRYQQAFEQRFERFRESYSNALDYTLVRPMIFGGGFLIFCVLSAGLVFLLGRDFFPKVDAGQIRLHMRARTGLRIEETSRLTDQVNQVIRETIPKKELVTVLDNIGLPYSGINLSYSNAGTIGTSDAEILVQLNEERGKPTGKYIAELRQKLPEQFPGVQFFFQPADIVTQILNFGTPAPIDVQVTGANQRGNYVVAEKLANEMRHIPGAVDVHVQQAFDAPTLHMDIDRTRAQYVGLQTKDVAQNLLVSLSSSFQTAPAFWLDPKNGVQYQIAVQTPQYRMDTYQALQNTPITASHRRTPRRNLALQRAAHDQCLCIGGRPRSRRSVRRSVQAGARRSKRLAEGQPHRGARASTNHAQFFYGPGVRLDRGHHPGLSAYRREFPVVARSFHHHHRASWRSCGHLLDASYHAHHAERAVADRRDHVHGRGHGQQHFDGVVRTRADGRRQDGARSSTASGLCAHAPGDYDRAGDDHRHGADGHGSWRRRRAERAAGARGHWRTALCDVRHALFCSMRFFDYPWTARAETRAAAGSRMISKSGSTKGLNW